MNGLAIALVAVWAGAFAGLWSSPADGALLVPAALALSAAGGIAALARRFGWFSLPAFVAASLLAGVGCLAFGRLAGIGWSSLPVMLAMAFPLAATLHAFLLARFWIPGDDAPGVFARRVALAWLLAFPACGAPWADGPAAMVAVGLAAALFLAALEAGCSTERMNLPASPAELSIPATQLSLLAILPHLHPEATVAWWTILAGVLSVGFAQLATAYAVAMAPRAVPARPNGIKS